MPSLPIHVLTMIIALQQSFFFRCQRGNKNTERHPLESIVNLKFSFAAIWFGVSKLFNIAFLEQKSTHFITSTG